jgi:hypothetical protein
MSMKNTQFAFVADAQLDLKAEAAPGQPKKQPTFAIQAYSGDAMRVGLYGSMPVVVDLAGVRAGPGGRVAVLKDHDANQVCGQGQAKIAPTGIEVNGTLTGSMDDPDDPCAMIARHAKAGFQWSASIGAWPERVERVEAGQSVTVNGRQFAGPMYVVRAARLGEVSFVAVGADETATAAIAASAAQESLMPDVNAGAGQAAPKQSDPPVSSTVQAAGTPTPPVVASADAEAAIREYRAAMAAEAGRVSKIRAIAKDHTDIQAKAIAEGWTDSQTEVAVLRAERPTAPAGVVRESNASDGHAIEAALCLTAGLPDKWVAAHLPSEQREQAMNTAVSARMRGFSLHALMDTVIAGAGRSFTGSRKSNDFIRAAFEADRMLRASGFSTVSLSGVLSNVANKALVSSYDAVQVKWPTFCGVRSLNDFKAHTRYRLDTSGSFKKVGSTGELKHLGLTDDTFTLQADTYGAIIALTRQMQINDDLGAFTQLPSLIGRLAAIRVEEAAFVQLLGNSGSFFANGNGNYISGAATALSIASLTSAEQKFMDFVSDGKPILSTPKTLLVGTALKVTADVLYSEAGIIASSLGSTSSKVTEPARNPHAGKYPPVGSPYINNTAVKDQDGAAITGQSSTAWFLFGDPAIIAAVAIGFLNGQQTPTIESAETDFATLGMQWRAFHDFGVGYENEKGAVMSAGV